MTSPVASIATPESVQRTQWRTVRQLASEYPAFTESAIRNLIFRSKDNGLANHLTRVGGRVLIDGDGFGSWIESQRFAHQQKTPA